MIITMDNHRYFLVVCLTMLSVVTESWHISDRLLHLIHFAYVSPLYIERQYVPHCQIHELESWLPV